MRRRIWAGVLAAVLMLTTPGAMNYAFATTVDQLTEASTEAVENSEPAVETEGAEVTDTTEDSESAEVTTEDQEPVIEDGIYTVNTVDLGNGLSYVSTVAPSHTDDVYRIDPLQEEEAVTGLESKWTSPYRTSVKNQDPYGTCWSFATIAASESSLWKEGLSTSKCNLSELHLAYFMSHSVTDPLGGTEGDSFVHTDSWLEGGNAQLAGLKLATWAGPVSESTLPYSEASESLSVSDSMAYKSIFHLENTEWIPMQNRDTIKTMLKKYGACASCYYHDNYYYNDTTHAYYKPSGATSNHEVTLVGWDDNYSKDNFAPDTPESNGAWLVKNSWGTGWGENGYFWVSYEDSVMQSMTAKFFDYGKATNYNNNYQYDGSSSGGGVTFNKTTMYAANVFTAQGTGEKLRAVGYGVLNSNYKVTIQVYKDVEDVPNSGTLVTTKTINYPTAGFHTVALPTVVNLTKGTKFAVVVLYEVESGRAIAMADGPSTSTSWFTATNVAESGQSYARSTESNAWQDVSNMSYNFCIKAYTATGTTGVTAISLNKTSVSVEKGKTYQLQATVTPTNATIKTVSWTSSNTKVATVDSTGKVTAVAAGTVTITCTAKDGSGKKATCKVTVTASVKVTKIKLNKTSAALNIKQTLTLKATVTPTNASNKAVTWKSSNTKIATVSSTGKVTAKAAGTVTITCTAKDGSGKKATCKITVYTNTEAYVARIYTKALGRNPEPAGLSYWTNEIQTGKRTPVQVAEEFFFAPEFTNKKLNNTEYVKVLYRTFMGREYDQGGLDYWVARLNKGESRKSVLESFAGCQEFKNIVKSFGL